MPLIVNKAWHEDQYFEIHIFVTVVAFQILYIYLTQQYSKLYVSTCIHKIAKTYIQLELELDILKYLCQKIMHAVNL